MKFLSRSRSLAVVLRLVFPVFICFVATVKAAGPPEVVWVDLPFKDIEFLAFHGFLPGGKPIPLSAFPSGRNSVVISFCRDCIDLSKVKEVPGGWVTTQAFNPRTAWTTKILDHLKVRARQEELANVLRKTNGDELFAHMKKEGLIVGMEPPPLVLKDLKKPSIIFGEEPFRGGELGFPGELGLGGGENGLTGRSPFLRGLGRPPSPRRIPVDKVLRAGASEAAEKYMLYSALVGFRRQQEDQYFLLTGDPTGSAYELPLDPFTNIFTGSGAVMTRRAEVADSFYRQVGPDVTNFPSRFVMPLDVSPKAMRFNKGDHRNNYEANEMLQSFLGRRPFGPQMPTTRRPVAERDPWEPDPNSETGRLMKMFGPLKRWEGK